MAHCDEYVELLSAAIDGALSPEEQARLEEHLNACPACKALYDDLNRVHQALLELPPVEVPAGLTDRILEAVAADNIASLPKPKKSAFRWTRTVAAAAVFALILLGAGTLRGQLNATKDAVPENFMPELYSNEADEVTPVMAARTFEGATNEEDQASTGDQQEPFAPATDRMTEGAPPAQDAAAQGAAKQSPASSPEVQTTGAQAPEPQPTEPPTESEADPEVTTFTVGDISALLGGVTDPENAIDITGSLFVPPVPNSEGVDMEIPAEGAPEEQGKELTEEEQGAHAALVRLIGEDNLEYLTSPLSVRYPFSGFDDPDDPDGPMADTVMHYERLSGNGKYYLFRCEFDLGDHFSTITFYAVPLDGGEILEGLGTPFWDLVDKTEAETEP